MQKKRHHHYVWKYYLKSWINEIGQLWCLYDNRIFAPNPNNIAQKKDFYKLKELTPFEIVLIKRMFIDPIKDPYLKQVNNNWISLFTSVFEIRKFAESQGADSKIFEEEFQLLIHNFEEDYHSKIEDRAIPLLNALKKEDLSFLEEEEKYFDFIFFLSVQYFRTKMIRNSVVKSIESSDLKGYSINLEKIWNICAHILATNMGSYFVTHKNQFSFMLLKNDTCISFITGDQPVINTYADYSKFEETDAFELYYPITPKLALLITKSANAMKEKVLEADVINYNDQIFKASEEQVFSDSSHFLNKYMDR